MFASMSDNGRHGSVVRRLMICFLSLGGRVSALKDVKVFCGKGETGEANAGDVMVSNREKLGGYFFFAGSSVPKLPRYMHNTTQC